MLRTYLPVITLYLAASASAIAQPRYRESAEPPLADGSVQQAGGQIPGRPVFAISQSTPVVIVDVTAPQFVANGKDIDLKLHVENQSAVPAKDVTVIYQLPKGGKLVRAEPKEKDENGLLIWTIGTLNGGARKEINLSVTPGPEMAEWNHIAKVRFEHGRQGKTKIARPELSVKVSGPSAVQQHDIVPLRLELTNPGLLEVRDIIIADNLPDGLVHQYDPPFPGQTVDPKNTPQLRTWKVPRLGPNEVRVLDFRVLAEKAGIHNQVATAVSEHGAKHESESKLTVQAPKLELTVEGPSKRGTHQTATYRVSIRNGGNAPLRNVTVSDRIPTGCDFVTASEGGQSYEREVQWILPNLQPNESRVVELTVKVANAGPVQHLFSATYRGQRQQKDVTTVFEPTAAIRFDVTSDKQAAVVGDTVRLTINVENFGSAMANNVRSVVVLPASLSFVSADPSNHRHEGGRVVFDPGTLSAGGRQSFSITAKASRAAIPAVVSVELESDQLESGKLRREESIAISDPRPTDR